MTHQSTCFGAFVPFLQEITNINSRENKENIPPPPPSFGRLPSRGKDTGKCFTNTPSVFPQHTSSHIPASSGDFGTPVASRQRPQHTGLTPGNKSSAPGLRSGSAVCPVNPNDVSLLSDGGDACCLFSSSLPYGMAPPLRLADLFPDPLPPQAHAAEAEAFGEQSTGESARWAAAPSPSPSQEPSPSPSQEPSQEPLFALEAARPPTVTRVTAGTAPLIAVGGRRVPADKLHLLRTPTPCRDGTPALVPSARPRPTAAVRVATSVSGAPAPQVHQPQVPSAWRPPPQYASHHETIILEFTKGVLMRFQPSPSQPLPVLGRRYLAAITSSRSPYDNVAYQDVGVCVCVQHHHVDDNGVFVGGERTIYDGVVIRELTDNSESDNLKVSELKSLRETASVECLKHFRFLNLPFEIEDVHYTFDKAICVVYYRIKPQEGTSSQPNISRLLRMLQFKLQCKVYLKTGPMVE